MKKIILIAGATGKMGEEFSKVFMKKQDFYVVKISSKNKKGYFFCNLYDKKNIQKSVKLLSLSKYKEIYIIHSVGKFKFEDHHDLNLKIDYNKLEINDDIFKSNFTTFKNLSETIIEESREGQKIIFCAFGSISDRYAIPWWQSYSKSKNLLREYMHSLIAKNIRCVFINVSSTEKREERIYADKKYWLKCKEVVKRSLPTILNPLSNFQEIDIIKINPKYNINYFKNLKLIRNTWLKQLYG